MDKGEVIKLATGFVQNSEGNIIGEDRAICKEVVGLKIYEDPILGFGDADDTYFLNLKTTDANLKGLMLPKEWLPGAETVISFFLPFSKAVRDSNKRDFKLPSPAWLHARIEGQALLAELTAYLEKELTQVGYQSVAPLLDERFWSKTKTVEQDRHRETAFTSNWSERHAAYVCGLGTFGLSKGLITVKGVAGRFGSVITQLYLEPDQRDYKGIYDYCVMCGECADNCPVHAISRENGKAHPPCSEFLDFTNNKFNPRYGCGKCQVGVPCESRVPEKPAAGRP